jgi:hypothetical protein
VSIAEHLASIAMPPAAYWASRQALPWG